MSEDTKNNPVIRISIAGTVGDKCQISFETYVDAASDVKFMNAITDKLMFVRDRQVAKYEIVDLERLFEVETNQLNAMVEDLARVDARHAKSIDRAVASGARVKPTKNPKEETERENIVTNIDVRKKRLATLATDIEKRKVKVAGE